MGKILVTVHSETFSGFGEAWVAVEQISEFATALEPYPLAPDSPAILEGGHGGSMDGSVKPQTLVHVAVQPQGGRGAVLVIAKLEDEIDADRSRDASLFQSVEARFLTDYPAITSFVAGLRGLTSGKTAEAVLSGADWR